MCLTIRNLKIQSGLIPDLNKIIKVSKSGLYVYKKFELIIDTDKTNLRTFYREKRVSLNGDILTADKFTIANNKFKYRGIRPKWFINQGIHAYTLQGLRRETFKQFDSDYIIRLHPFSNMRTVYARCFIPPDTPYIYGENFDIVTLQLIIPPFPKHLIPTDL